MHDVNWAYRCCCRTLSFSNLRLNLAWISQCEKRRDIIALFSRFSYFAIRNALESACIPRRVKLFLFFRPVVTRMDNPLPVEQNKKKTKVRISFDGSRYATKAAKECEVHRRPPAVPVTQSFNARNISPC